VKYVVPGLLLATFGPPVDGRIVRAIRALAWIGLVVAAITLGAALQLVDAVVYGTTIPFVFAWIEGVRLLNSPDAGD
jgi:hypothetical protein